MNMSTSQLIDNDTKNSIDNKNEESVNAADLNNSTKPGNNPQLIVSVFINI